MPAGSDKRVLYEEIISRAGVELYEKGQIVFPKDRVGIVMMGSCEIRKHNNKNLLKPYIVKKAIEGDIVGWAEGDEAYSSSPLSWIFVMQDNKIILKEKKHSFEIYILYKKHIVFTFTPQEKNHSISIDHHRRSLLTTEVCNSQLCYILTSSITTAICYFDVKSF